MISGKKIALCVSGGIAAYKACYLASSLVKAGADVRVCMTKNASEFVSPLTFETLTKNAVITDSFSRETPYEVTHISLAKFAELVIVAPATANIIGKAANGIADDFVSTFLLANNAPVVYAPAMNTAMYENPAVQANIQTLKNRGAVFIEPGSGVLACGDIGKGRMPEPEEIITFIDSLEAEKSDFKGVRLLVTAGPTRERIDDVRFISNRSTGKMGYEIARAAANRGAEVTLVSGPVSLEAPKNVKLVKIESAADMLEAVLADFDKTDIVIKAAAVADYRPAEKRDGKIKKSGDMELSLVRTQDILALLGQNKKNQVLIGFAAEMENLYKNAEEKLIRKNADMICGNDVSRKDIGFGSDENAITIFSRGGKREDIEKCSKYEAANAILDRALAILKTRNK